MTVEVVARALVVLLAAAAWSAAAGCGDSGGAGGGGGDASTASGSTAGPGPSSTSTGLASHPGTLADEGLIARYLVAEADAGQGPTELVDVAPEPLPLAIAYDQDTFFTQDASGRRGLRFSFVDGAGSASVAVDGTKILQGIHGSRTGTIEVVADITDVSNFAPLSHIGIDDEYGRFSLTAWAPTVVGLHVGEDGPWADFIVDLPATGRAVYHGVIDTDAAVESDRLRLFKNGARLQTVASEPALQGQSIDLSTGRRFIIGNGDLGGRSPQGTIYYVAIYSAALSDAQVLQNVGLLLADDDEPAIVAP